MDSVNNFNDWADVYDIIYDKRQDSDGIEFYKSQIRDTEGLVLEMACGTGRMYIPLLEEFGERIHGLDISEGMLEKTREKCATNDLEPTLYQGDSSKISLENTYDLVYYPFSSLQHLRGIKDQKETFQNCYNHLNEGGLFIFDLPVPSFEYVEDNYEVLQQESVWRGDTEYLIEFYSEITNEFKMECDMMQRVINADTQEIMFQTTFELTLLPKEQVELLLESTGFTEYSIYGDFEQTEFDDSEHSRMVFVAEK